jgi:hypothetical protein
MSSSPRWRDVAAGENRVRIRSWWTMAVPTRRNLVEGIGTVTFVYSPRLLWGKPQIWVSRIGRWRRATPLSLVGASFLEQTLARGGSQVEWCAYSRVDNVGSWRHGTAVSRWRTRVEVRAQGGGAVWRHGGVIGRIDKVYADLNHEDCSEVRWQ